MPDHLSAERRETVLDALQSRVDETLDSVGDEFPFVADPSTGNGRRRPVEIGVLGTGSGSSG